MNRTGLNIYPSTQIDAQAIKNILEASDLTFEWNSEFGCYFLEEEEENYDELETLIDDELMPYEVNYRIEGIF